MLRQKRVAGPGRLAAIGRERIILDPGVGFAKSYEQNLEIIRRMGELGTLGKPEQPESSQKAPVQSVRQPPETRSAKIVYAEETQNGQVFYVNAILYTDVSQAGRTDDLERTVNSEYISPPVRLHRQAYL